MPLKVIWAALDMLTIVVLGSGLYLWWVRRKKIRRGVGCADHTGSRRWQPSR
jgi:uncharacterized iron-regulated membrane protein